ncbi:MAG: hypothetical protein H0W84_02630 [Bacteroidetes bacterium]|nr:hypothetical protein [Bacteroidota bacterium]
MHYWKVLFIVFVIIGFGFRQAERQYKSFIIKENKEKPKIDSFIVTQSFDFSETMSLEFGQSSKHNAGVGFIQFDKLTGKENFRDIIPGQEDFISPRFFKTADSLDPVLLMCTNGSGYAYHVSIYKIEKNKIEKVGKMDLALNLDPTKFSTDPVPYAKMAINDSAISFSFTKAVAINFQEKSQKNYQEGHIKYTYCKGILSMETR